ncbi:MAG: hypothetical protein ACJ8LG_24720 [Massilia sp.]
MAANFGTLLTAKGAIHGTSLIGARGLWLALVTNRGTLQQAKDDLQRHMASEDAQHGVIILSRELAATTFGPVPQEWISQGISMHLSAEENIITGACAFLQEVFNIQSLSEQSLRHLAAIARLEPEGMRTPNG